MYYVEQINYLTQAKSKYSNMIVTIGKIINKLEYNSSSVEDMQKVVEDIISNQQ